MRDVTVLSGALVAAAGVVVAAVVGAFAALVAGLTTLGDAGWLTALVGVVVGLPLVVIEVRVAVGA
jgi:hypothetical protein